MNRDILEGNWNKLKGRIKERWGRLTDDEIDQVDGKMDRLVGKIQERYGKTRELIEKELDEVCATCADNSNTCA